MPDDTLSPFTADHLDAAAALFCAAYREEQAQSPLLPARALDDPAWVREALRARLPGPGVAMTSAGRLTAYMLTGGAFAWKGQRAALVPEYGHGAEASGRRQRYQRMYMRLAQEWADDGRHLHLIGHLAHDQALRDTLFHLGFGAILAERLRDLAPVAGPREHPVRLEPDPARLADIQAEHNGYYARSPIFLRKSTDRQEALADLMEHHGQGDVFLVYDDGDSPCAYMIVGRSAIGAEGFLLQSTNTAQIKSAYIREDSRGKGIGQALLQSAIDWARGRGYDRLFVEHETANIYGGNFWGKHFSPYVYFSMRYIDNTL